MKKFLWICACVCILILSGCSSSSSYERDDSAGEIVTLSVAGMEEKLENKDDFIVVFAQSWCTHCKSFNAMLTEYLEDHHVIVYEVVLDQDEDLSREEAVEVVQSYFPDMTGTPGVYYVEGGEIESTLKSGDDGLTEEKFDDWVVKYRMDEKQA